MDLKCYCSDSWFAKFHVMTPGNTVLSGVVSCLSGTTSLPPRLELTIGFVFLCGGSQGNCAPLCCQQKSGYKSIALALVSQLLCI